MDYTNPVILAGIGLIGVGGVISYIHIKTLVSNNCLSPGIYAGIGVFTMIGGYYLMTQYSNKWVDEEEKDSLDKIKDIVAS